MPWQTELTNSAASICGGSINKDGLPARRHFICFELGPPAPPPSATASSLLFLLDQAERGCGLNVSSHQQATSNLPPFASMVPINTLLPPHREATDSEGDRRGPGVRVIWKCVKEREKERERGRRRDRNRDREHGEAGRQLLVEYPKFTLVLRLPCRLQPSVKRSAPLLSPDTHTHTHTDN